MKRFFFIVIVILALLVPGVAQDTSDKERREKERQELEKKTLALLNEVASSAWSLKAPENRSLVMAGAAELLWEFDQKRARTLYWDALNSLNLTSATRPSGENLTKAEQEKIAQEFYSTFEVRQNFLRRVARKDAQLALDMLRATRQVQPKQYQKGMQFPDDRELEQEIASEVATRDPVEALRLARESLAKGFSYELLNLLYQLNRKDSEKATQFAGEIIAKLRSANVATDIRASTIAIELLERSRTKGPRFNYGFSGKALGLDDDQKRELVDSLTNAALTISANSNLLFDVMDLSPEIDQFFPERRAALEKKLATFDETLTRNQREGRAFDTLIREGKAEELVRKASSPEGEKGRPVWYGQAAIIAAARRQTDSFREFVGREIKDDDDRKRLLDTLDTQEIDLFAYRKRADDLQKLLPKIRRKEERARAMAELALLLKQKGEDQAASSLLDETATMIKTDLKSDSQTNALLTLLTVYAIVDPPKAFAIAERSVDEANAQISTLLLLDRVFRSGAVTKGELRLESSGMVDYMMFKYGKGVMALARADFGRTRALAERFERNELRVMARLFLVMSLLQAENSSQNDN